MKEENVFRMNNYSTKFNLKDVISHMEEALKVEIEKNDYLKSHISNDYSLAKLDFVVIENYCDCIETYHTVIGLLNSLQERIIERNRNN